MAKLTKVQKSNIARIKNAKHTITVGLVRTLTTKDKKEYLLQYRDDTEMGYNEHDITVEIGSDGHIYLGGDPEYEQVYLYPEQVKLLKQLLKGVK